MIRDGDKVLCCSWSAVKQEWNSVGEVVGGAGGSAGESGKVLYEGKEYDFVFTVELDEGHSLKLPYNRSEDPWFAAQRFINIHELPQEYLDQVANFIVKNAGHYCFQSSSKTFQDPFTGSSRYFPTGVASAVSSSDPFTGSGRYVPQEISQAASHSHAPQSFSPFYPQMTPLHFDTYNAQGIVAKLQEFNGQVDEASRLTDEQISSMITAVTEIDGNPQDLASIEKAIQWPAETVWPVLDVLRLALRSEKFQDVWVEEERGSILVSILITFIRPPSPATTQLMALRCFSNLAVHQPGQSVLAVAHENVLNAVAAISPYPSKNLEIAAATVILNISILLHRTSNFEGQCKALSTSGALCIVVKDSEAQFRVLVAVGTLLSSGPKIVSFAVSLSLRTVIEKLAAVREPPKIGECASHILQFFSRSSN